MDVNVVGQNETQSNGHRLLAKLELEKLRDAQSSATYDKHSDTGYSKHYDDWDKGRQ